MFVQGLRLYSPPPVGGASKSARLMQSTLYRALELLSLGVQYLFKISKRPLYWDFVPRRLTLSSPLAGGFVESNPLQSNPLPET